MLSGLGEGLLFEMAPVESHEKMLRRLVESVKSRKLERLNRLCVAITLPFGHRGGLPPIPGRSFP